MIYNVEDRLPFRKLLFFSFQLLCSVFVATVLIADICGVSKSGVLLGVGLGTLIYIYLTNGKSPMFISSSGAFVAPVLMAMTTCGYTGILVGGATTCIIYYLFGLIFSKISVESIYKVFPKTVIGSVTVVIGINLMTFIKTYVQVPSVPDMWGIGIAIFTAIVIALVSHYSKGSLKLIPFLIGTGAGYFVSLILTLSGIVKIIDFDIFRNLTIFQIPDIALLHMNPVPLHLLIPCIIIFAAFTPAAIMEALSDHGVLGNTIERDLYFNPGLSKIFYGEGAANLVGVIFGGVGMCSYGEGVACVGFSKVASIRVTIVAAVMMIFLSFFSPAQALIESIPSCVFGGASIILYGYIAASGIKTLMNVNFNKQKNLIIVSSILSIGISGIAIGGTTISLSGTALALIFGVVLNLILKDKY